MGSRRLHRLTCRSSLGDQAETLRPPLPLEVLDVVPVVLAVLPVEEEDDGLRRFRTISSLLLGARLSVTCCGVEPC